MNKFLNFSILLFAIFDLSSNSSLEITTIEIQESYNIIQNFPGKILPLNYSKLAFEVPGKIQQVKIDIGDAVKKGDILAFLDPSEMQANLNQAQARFDLAEQALKRFQDLKSKGFISNQELDRANSEFLIAKAQVDLYSVKLEQTYIRAPFDGYIQNRFLDSGTVISPGVPILEIIDSSFVEAHVLDSGTVISPGVPILEIIDSSFVEAHVSVPSNVIEGLMEGESYSFLIGMEIFPATLKRYTKMSGQGSDNRLCIFEFNTFISPGSVSYLQLRQKKIKTGAWVPLKSLSQGTQGLWNLYTVSKDNTEQFKVAKEIVELIHVEGDNAYISGTISTGDMVVSGGAEKVIENEILKAD